MDAGLVAPTTDGRRGAGRCRRCCRTSCWTRLKAGAESDHRLRQKLKLLSAPLPGTDW